MSVMAFLTAGGLPPARRHQQPRRKAERCIIVYMRPKLKEGWTCRPDKLDSAQEVNVLWQEARQKVRDGRLLRQAQLVDF